jgi:PAS domain S-box-containing protein
MAAIFGYTVEEMLGLDSLAIVQPCDHGLVTENMRRRLAGEVQSVHYEIHGRHKDGSTRYIEAYGTRVDMDGTPAFIGTLEDVTARKRNEQALRDSEAKFRATFMNGADALYIATLDEGRVVEVNDAFVKLFGYSRDEVIGKTPLQLNLFSNRTHWTRLLAELKANGHIIDFETVGRKKSGQEIAASMCCATFMLGGKWHIAGDIRDITERKQALDALRESEARLDEVARLAGIGFSIWDTQTDTTTGSAQLYRIFGWDPSQQPPKHSERSKIYTPESWARLSDAAKRAIARGEASELELDVVRPDGSIRHTRTYLGPAARDEHGHVVRLYGVIHDITDQKLAEQRLQQTLKSETIALLSRGIAHDFNNLIGAILAQVELLLIDASPGHPGGEELRRIEGLGRRASEIVRQLMIYAGQEQPCIAPVELSGLVKEILELLNISVSKNAVVRSELETNLPPVMADAAQLRQVIMNLVLNASEAIGNRPGEIGVTTSRFTVHKNYKEGIPGGDYLRLEISDTGCGMTEEVRARVFEPFYSTKGEGRGLGLATVHAIVRANRGFIDVGSVPGQGSRFEILLPAAASLPHGEAATPAGMPAQDPISQTVLVVEDEESLRLAAVKFLGKRGFAVLQAADGSAAIGLLEAAKRIDVILLDVTIPGISSQEVITRSRALQPDAKIVLTTAYSREMVMGNFEGTPISGFIRKPYRLGEMVHLLQEIVSA